VSAFPVYSIGISCQKLKTFYEISFKKFPLNLVTFHKTHLRISDSSQCTANHVSTNSGNEFITSPDVNTTTLQFLNALLFSDVNKETCVESLLGKYETSLYGFRNIFSKGFLSMLANLMFKYALSAYLFQSRLSQGQSSFHA
jgi:hypothetical protein